jgi:hypothetical protein
MHGIIFENSAENGSNTGPRSSSPGGLDLWGSSIMDRLHAGDVVWLVTRLEDDRATPAVCGRLVVDHVESHTQGQARYQPSRAADTRRVVVRHDDSRRCPPFACEAILGWKVWRRHFGGMLVLNTEQGVALEAAWAGARAV